jgi:hypothetical protein
VDNSKLSNHFDEFVALLPSRHSVLQSRLHRMPSRSRIGISQKIFDQIRKELRKMIDQLRIRQPFRAGDFFAGANGENDLLANERLPGDKMFAQIPIHFALQRHVVTTLIF